MQLFPDAFAPMAQYRQFICYNLVPSATRPGKQDKFPVDYRTGRKADAHDPSIWTDAQTAMTAAERLGVAYGTGFVLTAADPFFCVDIDGCLQEDNTWSPLALELCARFAGAAIEVSVSGRGLHIFATGTIPTHANKNVALGIELYSSRRFIALGSAAQGDASKDCSEALAQTVAQYFQASVAAADLGEWTTTPVDEWVGIDDDDQLIARACSAVAKIDPEAVFGEAPASPDKVTFADLWNRNVAALAKRYPETGERNDGRMYDESSADMALALKLAYWTGKNMERMLELMMRSGLKRDKYDREKYIKDTIRRACALTEKVAQFGEKGSHRSGTIPTALGIEGAPRGSYIHPPHQPTFFHGCVYIRDLHQILVPRGRLNNEAQFRADYGGRFFVMDAANMKTTKNAYEAFLESQVIEPPMADSTCFRPDLPPGAIISEGGRTYANVWWPFDVPRKAGDVSLFLAHVAKLLPDQRDQQILLSYMAACVQHKGTKFQWAPLIQGVQGNGKTTLTECVIAAIGRPYWYRPTAANLTNKFNGWLVNRLFYGVEDVFVSDNQREIIEILKPMITGTNIEIESKGVNQVSADVCGNFMFNSNHRDAIRKTDDDRRFAVFYTAQQTRADLDRDGMNQAYFDRLQSWLIKGDGYAMVTDFLHTYAIADEFNPAKGCRRAPFTSSTQEAITASRGGIEQEVVEAIESGRTGFAGGWISSKHLDDLLKAERKHLSRNKRDDMLATLGYVPHPGLPGGRANNPIAIDGIRSILYVDRTHQAWSIEGPSTIAKAYSDAQMIGVGFGATANQEAV